MLRRELLRGTLAALAASFLPKFAVAEPAREGVYLIADRVLLGMNDEMTVHVEMTPAPYGHHYYLVRRMRQVGPSWIERSGVSPSYKHELARFECRLDNGDDGVAELLRDRRVEVDAVWVADPDEWPALDKSPEPDYLWRIERRPT